MHSRTVSIVILMLVSSDALAGGPEGRHVPGSQPAGSKVVFSREALLKNGSQDLFIPLRAAMLSSEDRKFPSPAKAFFFSFLLPGMGERYAGSRKMMRIFLATEGLLWATFASCRIYGNWKRNDYRQFAASHAGVDINGKDHEYFVNIENFNSIQDYNVFKLQQRLLNELYPETAEYFWEWDSENSRESFEDIRLASDAAYSSSHFVLACVLLNHLVSGIDAIRVARKVRKTAENPVQLSVTSLPGGGGIVMLRKRF